MPKEEKAIFDHITDWFRELRILEYLQNILKRFALWVRNKITLERAWYLFTISLILFVILSVVYPDTFRLTLGISVLTIVMMYLIMMSSSIELQRATQTQVKAFVDNLQTVCTELKNVSSGISTLTKVMKEVQRTILESTLASKTAIAKAEAERKKRKESIKPQLSIRVVIKGRKLWIFDSRHYHLIVRNYGSDAIQTIFGVGKWEYGPHDIKINIPIDIDIGHINDFRGSSTLRVLIKVRDVDRNLYQGNVNVSLPQLQWGSVPLTEL